MVMRLHIAAARNRQHWLRVHWRWGHGLLERSDLHLERHDTPLKVARPLL
jgi:hypothetical protein